MARKKNRRELPDLRSIQISPAYYAGKCVGNLLRWLFLLAIAFIILYPLLYMVSMAFRSPKDFMDITVVWLPKTPTWDNFRTAVVDVHLLEAMKNTVLIAVGSSLLQILVTCLAGYGFARFHFKGSTLLFIMVVFTIVVPPQLLGMPNYLLMSDLNWIDTCMSVIVPAIQAPLGLYLMKQFMEPIPDSILESARMDGAREFRVMWSIVMPQVKPAWLTLIILQIQSLWGMSSTYLISEQNKTLAMAMQQIVSGGIARMGAAGAVSVVMMAVPILTFILSQSQVIETMSTSGMKE